MNVEKMPAAQLQASLKDLPGWKLKAGKLHRKLKFKNFIHAFGFMTQVALVVEQMNHHPEWRNVYNQVIIDLTTHEAGGISQRDIELARKINELLANMVL
jgi:4a-hydroxytetrahydrobiopterin dehydratase